MKDAALLGISTPLGSDNWLSAAINIKDENGVPYFPIIQLGLVCQKCMASGQVDIMNQCEHMKGLTPPWKSEERAERVKRITELLDDAARALRENRGVAADSTKHIFNAKHIKQWFENTPTIESHQYPDKIYVSVDPDAGGELTSSCAIVSGYRMGAINPNYNQMTFVVCKLLYYITSIGSTPHSYKVIHFIMNMAAISTALYCVIDDFANILTILGKCNINLFVLSRTIFLILVKSKR